MIYSYRESQKITELEAQLETSRANEGEADSKLAEVHSKLTEVYSKLKEAQSKLNEIQSKSARMKSELQAKKSEIREKDAEIQRKDAEIAKLNGELEETREVCKLVDQLTAQVASRRRAPEQTTSPVGNASTAAPSITATPAPARDRTIEVVSRATPASSSTSPITTPQSLINANQANPGPSPGPSDISTPAPAAKPPKPKTPAAFSVLNSVLEAHHHNTGMFPHKRKLYASGEPMRERIKTAWAKAAREK